MKEWGEKGNEYEEMRVRGVRKWGKRYEVQNTRFKIRGSKYKIRNTYCYLHINVLMALI